MNALTGKGPVNQVEKRKKRTSYFGNSLGVISLFDRGENYHSVNNKKKVAIVFKMVEIKATCYLSTASPSYSIMASLETSE